LGLRSCSGPTASAERHFKTRVPKKLRPAPELLDSPYLIEKHGRDLEFEAFGIHTSKIDPAEPRKTLTIEGIIAQNDWLAARTLIGPTYRADLYYLMKHRLAKNPREAARRLGCSYETAHRLWRILRLALQRAA
jgi:hypothetical protein